MALKKAYCYHCNKHDEQRRIFDVNAEAKYCYCPHCGKKYFTKVAMSNYDHRISHYNKRARFFLRNVVESSYSYSLYGYVLELEPENLTAKLGRLLSLAYMSTLRRDKFVEVKEMINISNDEFKLVKNRKKYHEFLDSLNACVDEYVARVKKSLTFHGYFYDTDCIKLYFTHLKRAIDLKRLIAAEFSDICLNTSYADVTKSIKIIEKYYDEVCFTVDGRDHYFANFTKTGDILITDGMQNKDTKLSKYRMATLDPKNKKLIVLKERVFPGMGIKMFNLFEKCFVFAGLLLSLAVVALIFYLIFRALSFSPILLSIFIVFTVFGLSFIGLRLILGFILKKPRT